MGILAFLTSSRLKAELTRPRDKIARMHQMFDMELAQRQEAEKKSGDQAQTLQTLTEETEVLRSSLDEGKTSLEKERQTLKQQIDEIARIRNTDVRITTLRQELDQRQRQRTKVTEQNTKLAERSTQLDKRLNEMAAAV